MDVFILATDPHGCQIECSKERWNYILSKHLDLKGYEEEVKRAIERPEHGIVYRSNNHPQRRIYYLKLEGKKAELKVVAHNRSEDFGEIMTAHFCSKRPAGEVPIW